MNLLSYQSLRHYYSVYNINNFKSVSSTNTNHSSLHYKLIQLHTVTHFNKYMYKYKLPCLQRFTNKLTLQHFTSTANSRCNCYTNYKLCFTQSVSITGL